MPEGRDRFHRTEGKVISCPIDYFTRFSLSPFGCFNSVKLRIHHKTEVASGDGIWLKSGFRNREVFRLPFFIILLFSPLTRCLISIIVRRVRKTVLLCSRVDPIFRMNEINL